MFTGAFRRPRSFSRLQWGHSGANHPIKWSSVSDVGPVADFLEHGVINADTLMERAAAARAASAAA